MTRARRYISALALVLCVGAVPACGPKPDAAVSDLLGPGRMLRFGEALVRVQPLDEDGRLRLFERVTLGEHDRLEFVAMLGAPKEASVEVFVRDADNQEELLRRSVAAILAVPQTHREETHSFFRSLFGRTKLDLAPYAGRSVEIGWERKGRGHEADAIGLIRFDRKPRDRKSQPDILLICSDTHRYDYALGPRGRQLMPNLAALAAQSVVYHRAFSPASWTLPAITSVMTGLHPRRHRTGEREAGRVDGTAPPAGRIAFQNQLLSNYPSELRTIAEDLRSVGYETVVVPGNWFYDMAGLSEDGFDLAFKWAPSGASLNKRANSILVRRTQDRPLFMLVHYLDVHDWYQNLTEGDDRPPASVYEQFVRTADDYLGALLKDWEEHRGLSDSLVVFFSDHGEHIGDAFGNGHGRSMQEALLHVPLVVKYPESSGIVPHPEETPVSLVDLRPTILDLIGAAPDPARLDGQSLLATEDSQRAAARTFFADYQLYGDELSSIRRGELKLVIDPTSGHERMYDLSLAGKRENDQLVERPVDRIALRAAFDHYVLDAQAETAGLTSSRKVLPEDALEGLRSLGYVE